MAALKEHSVDRLRRFENNRDRRRPGFLSPCTSKVDTTNYHMMTSLRNSTAIPPSLLPVSSGGVAPAHPRDA